MSPDKASCQVPLQGSTSRVNSSQLESRPQHCRSQHLVWLMPRADYSGGMACKNSQKTKAYKLESHCINLQWKILLLTRPDICISLTSELLPCRQSTWGAHINRRLLGEQNACFRCLVSSGSNGSMHPSPSTHQRRQRNRPSEQLHYARMSLPSQKQDGPVWLPYFYSTIADRSPDCQSFL